MRIQIISLLLLLNALPLLAGQKEDFQAESKARLYPNPFATSTATHKIIFEKSFVHDGEEVRIRVWATITRPEVELQIIQVLDKGGYIRAAKPVRVWQKAVSIWAYEHEERIFVYIRHQDGSELSPTSSFELGPNHEIIDRGLFFSEDEVSRVTNKSTGTLKGFCLGN